MHYSYDTDNLLVNCLLTCTLVYVLDSQFQPILPVILVAEYTCQQDCLVAALAFCLVKTDAAAGLKVERHYHLPTLN